MAASRSLSVVALILLIWNLIGIMAFVMQFTADFSTLARTDPITARIFAQMPGWAWAAYGGAVAAGTVGAILLLLRKAAAVWLFLLSLIGMAAQFSSPPICWRRRDGRR